MATGEQHLRVSVTRDNFFLNPSGGHLRWTEASPASAHQHGFECGCTLSADTRPAGSPESIRQEFRILWDDCVMALEDEVSEPWVTFRKARDAESWIARRRTGDDEADEDHAYVIFDGPQEKAKIEVASPGFGLIGYVMLDLFLGNRVDISRLYNGHSPSRVVDLSKIAPDQVWIYTDEMMRTLGDVEEITAIREAFRLAREVRHLARPHLMARNTLVDDVRNAVERDGALLASATDLRRVLSRFAHDIESTDLFRLAKELETELELKLERMKRARGGVRASGS